MTAVLLEDPDLAEGLSGPRLAAARRDCLAAVADIPAGSWTPGDLAEAVRGGLGLLILDGAVARRVGRQRRYGAELLGPGDMLRPWDDDRDSATVAFTTLWRVIDPLRVALLDRRFALRLGSYPEVGAQIIERAVARSRTAVIAMAIAHHVRVDRRLLLLLWHLADRWGRVTRDGVLLPLRLTHELLADLVGAQRPSVTLSLSQLEGEGLISRTQGRIVLHGDPPADDADEEDAQAARVRAISA